MNDTPAPYDTDLRGFEDDGEDTSLAQLLARRTPPTAPATPTAGPDSAAEHTSTPAAPPAQRPAPTPRRTRTPNTSPAAAPAGATLLRTLSLPDDVIDAIAVYRAREGLTVTQVVLRAIQAYHRRVDDLIEADQNPTVPAGQLFADLDVTPARRHRQITIRPTTIQLTAIDQVLDASTATGRSHLAAVCLRQLLTDAGYLST